jgi:hypothetical protein
MVGMEPSDATLEKHAPDFGHLRVLMLALLIGAVMFLLVVGLLSQILTPPPPKGDPMRLVTMLSAVNALMAPSTWFVAVFLYRKHLKAEAKPLVEDGVDAGFSRFLAGYRNACLLTLALFEGSALFGIVTCFLSTQFGVIGENPILWANSASLLGLLGAVTVLWPSPERFRRLVPALVQQASLGR